MTKLLLPKPENRVICNYTSISKKFVKKDEVEYDRHNELVSLRIKEAKNTLPVQNVNGCKVYTDTMDTFYTYPQKWPSL